MKYKEIKHQSDAQLADVSVEFEHKGDRLVAVVISDKDNKTIRIEMGGSYTDCVKVFTPEEFTFEDRTLVMADLPALGKVRQVFDDHAQALTRVRDINDRYFSGGDGASYQNIKAKYDKHKKLVGYVDVANQPIPDDDIPF